MKTRLLALAAVLALFLVGLVPSQGSGATPADPDEAMAKLDSGLKILAAAAAAGEPVTEETGVDGAGGAGTMLSGARVEDGDVLVNVYVDGSVPAAATELRGLGMRVTGTSDRAPERVVSGWLAAGRLLDATSLSATSLITAVHAGTDGDDGTDIGSVLSQGDAAHHGPQARTASGASGAGVKVGVISDSINQVGTKVAGSQGTGDLPGSVTVIADDTGATDEGRAMAEIIYDGAPGVTEMYFSTGTVSAAGKATSINDLVTAGVKVIADDIFYPDQPMFQDGIIAQAVDAAKTAGVTYLASAGNRARQSWEGTLNLSGVNEDFDPGAGVDTVQTLGTFTNRSPFIALQWAEPWGAATTDLALDVYIDGSFLGTANTANVVRFRSSSPRSRSPGHTASASGSGGSRAPVRRS